MAGRVLDILALGKDVCEARDRAYEAISRIRWPRAFTGTTSAGAR